MDGEQKFWVSVWVIVAIGINAVIYTGVSYWTDHNQKIADMVKSGVDPVAAMCAMQDDYGDHPTCVIFATKSADK